MPVMGVLLPWFLKRQVMAPPSSPTSSQSSPTRTPIQQPSAAADVPEVRSIEPQGIIITQIVVPIPVSERNTLPIGGGVGGVPTELPRTGVVELTGTVEVVVTGTGGAAGATQRTEPTLQAPPPPPPPPATVPVPATTATPVDAEVLPPPPSPSRSRAPDSDTPAQITPAQQQPVPVAQATTLSPSLAATSSIPVPPYAQTTTSAAESGAGAIVVPLLTATRGVSTPISMSTSLPAGSLDVSSSASSSSTSTTPRGLSPWIVLLTASLLSILSLSLIVLYIRRRSWTRGTRDSRVSRWAASHFSSARGHVNRPKREMSIRSVSSAGSARGLVVRGLTPEWTFGVGGMGGTGVVPTSPTDEEVHGYDGKGRLSPPISPPPPELQEPMAPVPATTWSALGGTVGWSLGHVAVDVDVDVNGPPVPAHVDGKVEDPFTDPAPHHPPVSPTSPTRITNPLRSVTGSVRSTGSVYSTHSALSGKSSSRSVTPHRPRLSTDTFSTTLSTAASTLTFDPRLPLEWRCELLPGVWTLETGKAYVAQRARHPVGMDELHVQVGDVLTVDKVEGDGWINGRNLRTTTLGLFPPSVLQIPGLLPHIAPPGVHTVPRATSRLAPVVRRVKKECTKVDTGVWGVWVGGAYVVQRGYEADPKYKDEIPVEPGDVVDIDVIEGKEWVCGKNTSTGKRGMFPRSTLYAAEGDTWAVLAAAS